MDLSIGRYVVPAGARVASTGQTRRRMLEGELILSFHITKAGPARALRVLRSRPEPSLVPGLRYAETMIGAPLRAGHLPQRAPAEVALIAAWDSDAALDQFINESRLSLPLERGWRVRLEPLRAWGVWSALRDLPKSEEPVDEEEPVAVLTLGRLRLLRLLPFISASAPAEREALSHPGVLAATGLARPPRLVATFSLWRTAREMRQYAVGETPGGHLHAVNAHKQRAFHHESVFVRFRPYAAEGSWGGRDPLAALDAAPAHT
jgi:hypothetical protein